MRYYSEITKSGVTEPEALKQIIDLCGQWHRIAQPPVSLDQYLQEHPDLLDIARWSCFKKIG